MDIVEAILIALWLFALAVFIAMLGWVFYTLVGTWVLITYIVFMVVVSIIVFVVRRNS